MASHVDLLRGPPLPAPPLVDAESSRPPGAARPERPRTGLVDRLERRFRKQVWEPLDEHVGGALRRRLNAGRRYRPVFVCGAMGSGTTLLALSLYQRFDCAAAIRESTLQVAARSFLHGLPPERYGSVKEYRDSLFPRLGWSPEEGRADLLHLYRSCARGRSDVVVDKGPNANLVRARFLAECFPEARFVVVFRDPVAVVEGFRRKWPTFAREPLAESIRFYRDVHERFLEDAAGFGDRVLAVEYEELVTRYEETLAQVASHVGLEPARRPRRLEHRSNGEGRGIRNVSWGGSIGLVHDANRAAYERLDPAEVRAIRTSLEPLQGRLRAVASPVPEEKRSPERARPARVGGRAVHVAPAVPPMGRRNVRPEAVALAE